MRTRLAIVVATFPPYRSGLGNVAYVQARLLAAEGFPVTVYTPVDVDQTQSSGFTVAKPRVLLRYGHAASWCPRLAAETAAAEIVLLHYPFFGGVEAFAWRPKRRGQRLVVYYHMDTVGEGLWRFVFWLHRTLFLKPLLRRADAVLVSSYDYAHTSAALRPLLPALRGKLREVRILVDGRRFTPGPKPPRLRQALSLAPETPTVLFVSALDRAHYFKGLSVLLTAWQRVRLRLPSARLLIAGDGDRRAAWMAEAAKRGLDEAVVFLGALTEEELPDYYRLADLVVLPSTDRSEALGLVLLEAMASGRAAVASRLPGVASVIRTGETGYLVPPGEPEALAAALERLLRMPSVLQAMGEAGRRAALSEYSEAAVVPSLLQALAVNVADAGFQQNVS